MNKTFKYSAIWLVASAMMLTGCLERDYSETTPKLGLGGEDEAAGAVEIIAQNVQPDDPEELFVQDVQDTVYVKTNRSWSAKIVSAGGAPTDWISIDLTEYENLANYTQSVPIVVTCERNKTQTPRSAILRVTTPDQEIDFPITQLGAVYTLDAIPERDEMGSMPDTTVLKIRTNAAWTAEVVGTSTAGITLALTEADEAKKLTTISGYDNKNLKVIFAENYDIENGKDGQLKVTVDGIEKLVDFSQIKASPYALFRTEDHDLGYRAESAEFRFASNANWTMEMVDNTFSGASLSYTPSSGAAAQNKKQSLSGGREATGVVTFNFDFGRDPGVKKSVTFRISPEGGDPVNLTFTQEGCLRVTVMKFDKQDAGGVWAKAIWPFSSPLRSGNSPAFHTPTGGTTTSFPASQGSRIKEFCGLTEADGAYGDFSAGFPFVIDNPNDPGAPFVFLVKGSVNGSNGGIWLNPNNQGLLIGRNIGDFIQFPAFEGLALKKVIWEPSPTMKAQAYLSDMAGTALSDAKMNVAAPVSKENVDRDYYENHVYTFEVPDPVVGAAYKLCLSVSAGTLSVKDLILVYE